MYSSRRRRTFSPPWQFSPSVQPLRLSTREAISLKPSLSAAGRSKNSGEAEMTRSSARRCSRYQAFMSPRCPAQKASTSASTSGSSVRKE